MRLDFIDRLPADRRALAATAEPDLGSDLLGAKLARSDGLLLRDGRHHRMPGIVVAALEVNAPAPAPPARDPAVVFDVLAGEITAGGEVAQGNIVGARQLLAAYAATLRRTLGIEPPESLARIVRETVLTAV